MLVRLLHLNSTSHNLRLLSLASEPLPNKSMTIQSFFHKAFRFFFTISLVQLSLVLHVTLVQKVPPPVVPLGLGSAHLTPALSLQKGRAPQPQFHFVTVAEADEREEGKEGENEGTNEAPSSRMSTKRRRTGQSSSRSGAAREPPPQQLLPDDIEKENAAVLDKLPREVWERILDSLGQDDLFPFALTCRYFRDLRLGAVTAANDSKSRWRTVMRTELKTYTYIQTSEDVVYLPTIEEGKYPLLLPLILLRLLLLTTLSLVQSSTTACSPCLLTMSSGFSGRQEVLTAGRRL